MFNFSDTSFVFDLGNLVATVVLSVVGITISFLEFRIEKREKKEIEEKEQYEKEAIEKLKKAVDLKDDINNMELEQQSLQSKINDLYASLNVVDFYKTVIYFDENVLNELAKINTDFASLLGYDLPENSKDFASSLGDDLPKNSKYFSVLQSQIVFDILHEYFNNCRPELVKLQEKTSYLLYKLKEKKPDFENDNISFEYKKELFLNLLKILEDVINCFNNCNSKYNTIIMELYFLKQTFGEN